MCLEGCLLALEPQYGWEALSQAKTQTEAFHEVLALALWDFQRRVNPLNIPCDWESWQLKVVSTSPECLKELKSIFERAPRMYYRGFANPNEVVKAIPTVYAGLIRNEDAKIITTENDFLIE